MNCIPKDLSRFTEPLRWVMASPAEDPPQSDADLLVCHQAVRKKGNMLRTYVLVNYTTRKKFISDRGEELEFMSTIYRHESLAGSELSRISAIVHFAAPFGAGETRGFFSYPDQAWEIHADGFSEPLNRFMRNFAPA